MQKRILSIIIIVVMCVTILPVLPQNVYAATSIEFAPFSNWYISKAYTHATFSSEGNGVKIAQTKQTRYASDGTTNNSKWDGTVTLALYKNYSIADGGNSVLRTEGFKGNVKIVFKYTVDNVNESANGSPFYNLVIPGYAQMRIYGSYVTVLNSSSASDNKVENKKLTSNSAGTENICEVNIDTVNDTFTIQLNGSSTVASGTSMSVITGEGSRGYVDRVTISNLERAGVGAYLSVGSFTVESEEDIFSQLSGETKAIVATFPNKLASNQKNVTENVTIPWEISGLKWKSSDHTVMNEFGKIQRKSDSDPQKVEIFCVFTGKTVNGGSVTLKQIYNLTVTGLSNAVDVTSTINPSADSEAEKWYTMPQRGETEDGYPMFDDPMHISDEAFFGVWDSASGKWTTNPFFRYAEYPDMKAVETAAKAGDYETAKAQLQAYYKRHFSEKTDKQTSLSEANQSYHRIMYEYLSRNAYPTSYISSFPINIFTIPKTKSEVKIDVTNRINEAIGSFTCFSTMIASIDKYKNQALIYSKESSTPPVLVITLSDGTVHQCAVLKDSYIQAGAYSNDNHGSDTVLYAEEAGVHNNFEDRTKRVYIGFDISGFKKGAVATDAYIKITGEHNGSDAEKTMLLYWYCDSSWQEDSVCFNTFTDHMYFSANDMNCWDYVTSNITTVKGKVCGYHRGGEVGSLADLYSFMDHIGPNDERYDADYEKYAYTYIRQHMALVNAIGVEPDVMNSLDFSGHITTVAQDTLRLINSKYMTPDRFTAFLKHLWMATEYKIYGGYGTHYNNWATFSTGAVYAVCARYPEFARYNTWLEATRKENNRVTNNFVFDDGMSIELSQGYTNTILSTFNAPYALMKSLGSESPYDENTEKVLYDLVMSLFKQTAPGGGGFGLSDSTNPYESQKSLYAKWYNYLFDSDPVIAYMSTDGAKGWLPDNATTNFPVGLRTFMRSDWSDEAVAMSFTNKMVGSHGHKDALSVAMYAYGKFLLVDPGYGAILTGNIRNYMISPQQHNILTVNDYTNYLNPQTNAISSGIKKSNATLLDEDGKEECFDSNKHYDFIEYSTEAYTTSQLAQRSVTFLKDAKLFVVTDYVVPNDTTSKNVYTQNWHMYPGSNMSFDNNKAVRSNFENEPNVMLVPVNPDEIDEASKVKCLFSEESGQFIDNEKAVYKKTKAGNTTFSTIILPMDAGEDFEVKTTPISNSMDANMFRFEVINKATDETRSFLYYHLNDASLKTTVTVGSYKTDAQTLIVEEYADTNYIKSMYMLNGTFVSKKGKETMRTTEESSVAFVLDNKVLDYSVYDSDATALNNVTFNASLADKVTYNGVEYEHTVVDGKITFSGVAPEDDPVLKPTSGKLIYDSSVNPELIQLYTPGHEYYKVSNLGKDGIKFENIVSVPYKNDAINADAHIVGRLRTSAILEQSEENGTKTISDFMVGKYAIEFTIQQNIDTQRKEDGKIKSTFSSIYFGTSNTALTSNISSFADFRLYTERLNIIRTQGSQKDYIRADVSNVSAQTLKADTEWKLRIVFDTVNKNYTVFVNDVLEPNATLFPYNVVSSKKDDVVTWKEKEGSYLPDIQINLMEANTVGSYVWIKNIKIYEIEAVDDARKDIIKSLPEKLSSSNPAFVNGNLNIPVISGVTFTSGNPLLIDTDGILKSKVTVATPITFTATGMITDTEVTTRKFTFTKTYDMTVVSNLWTLSASNSGKTVKASVLTMDENYSLKPTLFIVGYDNMGKMCDIHIKTVTQKLENYEYTLNNETATIKVFLMDKLSSLIPLTQHIELE